MQSTFHTGSNSRHLPISWKIPGTQFTTQKFLTAKPKTLSLTRSSLRISLVREAEPDGRVENGPGPNSPVLLPVVIRSSGRVSRYFWDGDCLRLVRVDGGASHYGDFYDGFRKLFRIFCSAVKDFLIPKQVSENYMHYVKWKFLHRVFSSALQVLATQAMFRAIGIGYSQSLPSAAALNWVLKDGLGRLSRCIYTASLASAFDTNLKRVRFWTSVLFSASVGLELLTSTFPEYFLLIATVANIAKQISLACYLATGSAVHRSFAIADNLGEVSAKAQIQTVCFDNLGLMLAAILNMCSGNSQRVQAALPFFVYPVFASMDLLGIHQGLKHVHLRTLNKDRLEIILNTWIELRYMPSPAEVSKKEGINFLGVKGKCLWPIRIGCLNPQDKITKWSMMAMQYISSDDYYFICPEILCSVLNRTSQQGVLLCLREGADTAHVIMGLLQACYIRKALLASRSGLGNIGMEKGESDSVLREWSVVVKNSKLSAQGDFSVLIEQMTELGWAVKNILLTTQEQARYNFVDE
ncbi:Protein root UVB sensitive like [Quillaja saponaria]|uniref:Protein root UVB sensitive like n=1 Tax=Quillaja saponaria TaxID=32244 RepID=A0AAD7Q2X8_QUISA|nr:Protein root UVB sensitive like [Quillaja saponaria]